MLQILTEVDELRAKEIEIQSEIKCHRDQIEGAERELARCGEETASIKENELRLKRELTDLRDQIFARPDEEVILVDEAHDPAADAPSPESERHRSWKDRQKHLRTIG
jgi:predicted nuclease with TOPRIM domain